MHGPHLWPAFALGATQNRIGGKAPAVGNTEQE